MPQSANTNRLRGLLADSALLETLLDPHERPAGPPDEAATERALMSIDALRPARRSGWAARVWRWTPRGRAAEEAERQFRALHVRGFRLACRARMIQRRPAAPWARHTTEEVLWVLEAAAFAAGLAWRGARADVWAPTLAEAGTLLDRCEARMTLAYGDAHQAFLADVALRSAGPDRPVVRPARAASPVTSG